MESKKQKKYVNRIPKSNNKEEIVTKIINLGVLDTILIIAVIYMAVEHTRDIVLIPAMIVAIIVSLWLIGIIIQNFE